MTSISTLRRRAAARGETITKLAQNHRHYWQYGPFMVTDAATTALVESGLDLVDLRNCYPSLSGHRNR